MPINPSALPAPGHPDARASILLVDDTPANLLALEAILEDLGPNLVKARSGEEALRWLFDHDFAVVLLDVRMHGLDGFETAKLIRRRERSRHTPIIFLTAHDDNRLLVEEAYSLGAVDYLVKPLVPVILRAKVAGFLDLFQKTEEVKRQAEQLRQLERREFERKLAEENARFRALTEHSSDGVSLISAEGTLLYSSPSSSSILGYDPAENLGRAGFEFLHPDDQERVRGLLADLVRAAGTPITAELRVRARDGSWRWLECVGTNLLHEPTVQAVVVNFRDITERQRTTEALRESEERFARFMQHLTGLAWIKDARGRYVYANEATEKAFGACRTNLYGKTDEEVFSLGAAAQFKENDRRALLSKTGVQVIETLKHQDGTIHHSIVSKFPIPGPDGGPAFVGGMAIDITERLQAEESLRESEEQFHTLADSIPQLAWMAGADGRIIWYNRQWYDYTGTTAEQGEFRDWQSVLDPAELPRVMKNWEAAFAAGAPWEDTFPLRRHDGQMRWHLARALPVRNEQGQVLRWFGTCTDIEDRKQMEWALKEGDRRKDEFLAMLAHELRNPLAPIRNAMQIMRLVGSSDPNLQRSREMIERQVQHLTRLVDDLLDVSRITRGKIALRKEPVDLASILARAVETSRPLIEANRHKLTLPPFIQPILVLADPTRLEQVFANLLNNAAKYTERGGSIGVEVEQQGKEVLVRVRDTGFGIPAEVLPHVFDLFTQADRTLDRAQGGLGIGLTLVKTLVEMHGGGVTAHSAGQGKGSEFVVRLPVSEEKTHPGKTKDGDGRPPPAKESAPLTILVVDDNKDAADSLAMLLRLWGHEVRTSHDGLSGLKAASSYRPGVVLLDIGLPGMDGYEVARRLRSEFGRAIRLAALTGYGQEEDRAKSRAAGFDAHLVKPADPATLQALLEGWREPGRIPPRE